MYQIYLDELYGGLQKPNEDEKKKYVILKLLFYPCSAFNVFFLLFIFSLEHLEQVFIDKSFFLCRLAEKKATIGYTYEDSTVTEPEPHSDKDEENSENSESEEDEGIPDIGEEMVLFCNK